MQWPFRATCIEGTKLLMEILGNAGQRYLVPAHASALDGLSCIRSPVPAAVVLRIARSLSHGIAA